jgi:hypothetical protein
MTRATITTALADNDTEDISPADVRTSVLEAFDGYGDLAFGAAITASPDGAYPDITFTRLTSADSDWGEATNGSLLTWRGPAPGQHQSGWLGFDDVTAFTIVLDMGAAVDGAKLILTGHYGHDQINRPIGAKLEKSSDDVSYSTVKDWGDELTQAGAGVAVWSIEADISGAGAYRYWKWTITPDATWVFVGPMYFLK